MIVVGFRSCGGPLDCLVLCAPCEGHYGYCAKVLSEGLEVLDEGRLCCTDSVAWPMGV